MPLPADRVAATRDRARCRRPARAAESIHSAPPAPAHPSATHRRSPAPRPSRSPARACSPSRCRCPAACNPVWSKNWSTVPILCSGARIPCSVTAQLSLPVSISLKQGMLLISSPDSSNSERPPSFWRHSLESISICTAYFSTNEAALFQASLSNLSRTGLIVAFATLYPGKYADQFSCLRKIVSAFWTADKLQRLIIVDLAAV
jgi:hypothetical protein